jgi:hypothetical protein
MDQWILDMKQFLQELKDLFPFLKEEKSGEKTKKVPKKASSENGKE